MNMILKNDWKDILSEEIEKEYFQKMKILLDEEYKNETVYPNENEIFSALDFTPYEDVKAVIFGQDPYHGENQACGFSFSVKKGVKIPPSLRNIYKELEDDLGYEIPNHGNLESWAEQGVLLLNTVLTVREKMPNSHKKIGWENFTDKIIEKLNDRKDPIVFILWGKNAWEKESLITNNHHFIVKSFHPSPFAARRGFFGSKPFSKTNDFLKSVGQDSINWKINNI